MPIITPVAQAQSSDKGDGWQTVTRKGRDKGKRPVGLGPSSSNSYMALIEEEEDCVERDMDDRDGDNPIPAQ